MKASNSLWREQPIESPFPELVREIEIYETEIELRKQGKLDEKLFAETRLRRGAYGQRYDNGQRWDGKETQTLPFSSSATQLTKGANTAWDAPGMQRIKVPFGGMTPQQLEVMAELAEEYSDGPTADVSEVALNRLAELFPLSSDPDIADTIANVVDAPFGTRPLRVHLDPDHAGAAVIDAVADRIRAESLRRVGLADLLKPAVIG